MCSCTVQRWGWSKSQLLSRIRCLRGLPLLVHEKQSGQLLVSTRKRLLTLANKLWTFIYKLRYTFSVRMQSYDEGAGDGLLPAAVAWVLATGVEWPHQVRQACVRDGRRVQLFLRVFPQPQTSRSGAVDTWIRCL